VSSRWSQRGTRGYRTPAVCTTPKPLVSQPPATAHWTIDYVFLGDAGVGAPASSGTVTSNDATTINPEKITLTTYPFQPTYIQVQNAIPSSVNACQGNFQGSSLGTSNPTVTLPTRSSSAPYDSGTLTWGSLLHPNLGTVRVRTQ
jgi:hypothetical protein